MEGDATRSSRSILISSYVNDSTVLVLLHFNFSHAAEFQINVCKVGILLAQPATEYLSRASIKIRILEKIQSLRLLSSQTNQSLLVDLKDSFPLMLPPCRMLAYPKIPQIRYSKHATPRTTFKGKQCKQADMETNREPVQRVSDKATNT